MKKLIFWALLFPIAIFAQNATTYTIQIGTFVNPKIADFQAIQSYGYLYAESVGGNFSRVFLGEFGNQVAAANTLNQVRRKGYAAFLAEKPIIGGKPMIVVQFTTEKSGLPINWEELEKVGKLYTLLEDPKLVKIITGPFNDLETARVRVEEIKLLGYQDAFVKTVNPNLLHEVSAFEKGTINNVKNLNAAVAAIINDQIPQSYEANTPKIGVAKNVANLNTAKGVPAIRAKIKRTAALDLQKILKTEKYYAGSLDGFYGKETTKAYQKFEADNQQYKKQLVLNSYFDNNEKGEITGFQALINDLPNNPVGIINQLKASKEPLAKAYQAYWLLANGGNIIPINQLMNSAIQTVFADKKIKNAPPFDFTATYSYEDLAQFILHLRYLHAAPKSNYAIPCWLFERHPKEAFAAFKTKSKFASFSNTKIATCKSFEEWKTFEVMLGLIAELQPASFSKEQLERQETLEAARAFLYLFPQKLEANQKQETDKWLRQFWKQLESSATNHPVLAKKLPTLKILFFQSQILLEDYYMSKLFTPDAAEGLALSVLKTYVDVPLGVYLN